MERMSDAPATSPVTMRQAAAWRPMHQATSHSAAGIDQSSARLPQRDSGYLFGLLNAIVEQRGWRFLGYAALSGTSMLCVCANGRVRALLGSAAGARLERRALE